MAGEDEGRSRYSWFISERQEHPDRRVGLPRRRSEMVGASQADRRSDRSRSQVSQLSVQQGGERGRRDCRRDYPVSQRRVRSEGFRGERPWRNDWRSSHEWRDCQARRDFRYPESRRGSGRRSHIQSATMNCGGQQPAAQGGVSSWPSRGCRSTRAPSPSTRRSCTLPTSEEIGSLERKEGRKATRLPSPPSRRTVTFTSGTDGAIGRADNMETGSTGCRVNAEDSEGGRTFICEEELEDA